MAWVCPCPTGSKAGGPKRLVELSPFRDAGSGSDEGDSAAPPTLADKAKGWLSMAAKPLHAFKESREKAAARVERESVLKAGTTMKLLPDSRSGSPQDVRVTLASDNSMLTWSGAGVSGVMALSAVRDIKCVLASGFFSKGAPIPGQWMLVADDQTVRFEASSDDERQHWMETLDELCKEQLEAKSGRKLAAQAKRRMGLEERKREAEKRKNEILKTCSGGGMKFTAQAMMSRT